MTTEVLRNMLYAGSPTLRRPRLRRDGRGALPRRPVPRRGLGRGDHPPAGRRCTLVSLSATVSNAEEFADWLVTVRGETDGGGQRAPAGAAVAAHAGRQADVRPVPRRRTRPRKHDGAPGAAALHPRGDAPAGPDAGTAAVRGRRAGAAGRRWPAAGRAPTSSSGSTARACCRRSCSSSAGPAATPPCSSACAAGLRLTTPDERGRDPRDRRGAHRRASRPRTSPCSATGSGSTALERGLAAHHAGHAAGVQGDRSRSCSSAAWSRPSSPPRRWRSASTCRPGAWCWSGWSSSTARPTST